ncbi:E3 ubiquitin-protein ligase RNF19A-like [Halichoeres trimaculatus]|uniref:E3 ubiquitin-protein ligase RNF19A-like n=1 Tax=Halichoeres trimaculatus TaxID=147232 RepID=UPI003D9E625F
MNLQGQEQAEKKFDPRDTTMKFAFKVDDLDFVSLGDGDSELTAELSCGHAVTPDSLTQWCVRQLNEGKYKFRCPVVIEGTRVCNKQWSYQEVRRLADLSVEEMKLFEETMARLAAADYCEIKQCPQCKTIVERMDLANLCVVCSICTADQGKTYQFCWQCLKTWKGPGPRSDRCDNKGCVDTVLHLLKTCKSISLPAVEGVTNCPSVRACPTCGMRVEHTQDYCKNIHCPRCQVSFCFVCLKLKSVCIKTSSPYKMCPDGVAPRQTSIPEWRR